MKKSISIFGGFLEPTQDQAQKMFELGKFLSSFSDTEYYIGGLGGCTKHVIRGISNSTVSIIVVGSTQGKESGFVVRESDNIKAVYQDGYFGKKQELFKSTVGAFLILPDSGTSLGTLTEIVEAIDHIKSFDVLVSQRPRPIVFYGECWRKFVDEVLSSRMDDITRSYVHFIGEKEYTKIATLLELC